MLEVFTPEFFTQGGIYAIVFFFSYKAIIRLYTDIRKDSAKRETILLEHLNKVSQTLEKIDKRMFVYENRMSNLETKIGVDENAKPIKK